MLTATAVASRGWIDVSPETGGGGTYPVVVDPTITSWAQLAAVATVALPVTTVIGWIEASTLILKVTQLLAGTDASDTAAGVQRPADYNGATNAKVWYQVGNTP